jgi:hypothetical protein
MASSSRAGHRASSPTSATAGPDAQAARLVTCAPRLARVARFAWHQLTTRFLFTTGHAAIVMNLVQPL